ncbi:hypothetical protein GJU39_17345 [Pedobacter petrophilus]|uniref:IPT/TIG domain-containing protein n=2 Tax=Pedobacter petrophilus TaxID=1908241 RepID=A0A7K0G2G6_9SPHI|nr:hypothetical protein [Pedobacter petrophilus]
MFLNKMNMKKINKQSNFAMFMVLFTLVLGYASCKKTDEGAGGQPVITRVRLISKTDTLKNVVHRITLDSNLTYDETRQVTFDSTIVAGRLNNQYAIVGENLLTTLSVSFNGLNVNYNPALLTDHSIIISIPEQTPYGTSQSNKLVVTTKFGTASFDFPILQPPPVITSFSPVAAGAGETVTLTGTIFEGVTKVAFDLVPAEIIGTPTKTQIQVKVPAGVVQSRILVTTPGGTTRSAGSFGFKSLLYDDAFPTGWGSYFGYNSTRDLANTLHVKRGTSAIENTFTDGYGALQIGYNGSTIDVARSGLTAIKLSIYGGAGIVAGSKVQLVINGNYGNAVPITLTPGTYTDYTIPLKDLGSPTVITEFVLQSLGNAVPSVIYVDDIGFI